MTRAHGGGLKSLSRSRSHPHPPSTFHHCKSIKDAPDPSMNQLTTFLLRIAHFGLPRKPMFRHQTTNLHYIPHQLSYHELDLQCIMRWGNVSAIKINATKVDPGHDALPRRILCLQALFVHWRLVMYDSKS